MLRLTDSAGRMIPGLLADAGLPSGAGLRIAQRDDHVALAMSVADGPGPDDTVLLEHAARVFLGPVAGVRLAGSTLDARTGSTGSAFFLR